MEPFVKISGVVAPLDRANVDTDQIIPKQFLKRIERTGYGEFAFFDWRYLEDGAPNPDFVLNEDRYQGARILVGGQNFGSGSSREHAAWALNEYGIKVVIAPSIADIFRGNCFQNGMLPLIMAQADVDSMMGKALQRSGYKATVDLESQTVSDDDGWTASFDIDPFRKKALLRGLDEVGQTLEKNDSIAEFESANAPRW
jgi:3-isopropylmalate/(R)-2-methylmalate dehydratase small subunit